MGLGGFEPPSQPPEGWVIPSYTIAPIKIDIDITCSRFDSVITRIRFTDSEYNHSFS